MKKIIPYLPYILSALFVATVFFAFNKGNKQNDVIREKDNVEIAKVQTPKPADRIQVFLFHATHRCSSCITVGKLAQKTIEQKFPEELKSEKIEFREINIDLPENRELATKFKAIGSSLFLNKIIEGKDNIEEDAQVWRLFFDEQNFISYLSDKIKTQL